MPPLKKKIKVRKSPSEMSRNLDDEYHIPIAAQDSKWNGICFRTQQSDNTEHLQGSTEEECEIKLIDLESTSPMAPLLLLFPDLRHEESVEHLPITSQKSTSSLTRLLYGKTAKLELLHPSKKLKASGTNSTLDTVPETSDTDSTDSEESKFAKLKPEKGLLQLPVITNSDQNLTDNEETDLNKSQ